MAEPQVQGAVSGFSAPEVKTPPLGEEGTALPSCGSVPGFVKEQYTVFIKDTLERLENSIKYYVQNGNYNKAQKLMAIHKKLSNNGTPVEIRKMLTRLSYETIMEVFPLITPEVVKYILSSR